MLDKDNIRKLAEEELEGSEVFLADVIVKPGNKIFVFLDGDRDVTIEDCSGLNRQLNSMLSEEDMELMVSSYGADRPLRLPRQYNKNLGRTLKFHLKDGKDLSGKLETIKDDGIIIRPLLPKKKNKKKTAEMPDTLFLSFEEIETAKVNLSFNKQ